jgi:hypothetical protein
MHSFLIIDFCLQLVWIVVYNFEKEKMMLAMSNFLFQDGANVAYLSMDNHKNLNMKRIWHYLSNLDFFFNNEFFVSRLFSKSLQVFWRPSGH